ncbi:MAG: hypothetical protein ABIJ56_22040 [Pseudomonadota bacterium]
MHKTGNFLFGLGLMIAAALIVSGCAAGDPRFTSETPAGFWQGLWHGIIAVIAFIISLFSDKVTLYEVDNTGGWYNFGFLLGTICVWGGSWGAGVGGRRRCKARKISEKEWEEIGKKVEKKVMRDLKDWTKDEGGEAGEKDGDSEEHKKRKEEWEEIGKKVESKIKRKIKDWADEE